MKSAQFGLALELHRSRQPQRLAVLLLIAALAMLVLWLLGSAARQRGLARYYQANTVRERHVLSVIFLGMRIIERAREHFSSAELDAVWRSVARINAQLWADGQ